jgi:hypothetical protein
VQKTAGNEPSVMEGRSYEETVTALYDTKTDPGQNVKIEDPEVEARLVAEMAALFAQIDAPAEMYDRFNLPRAVQRTAVSA